MSYAHKKLGKRAPRIGHLVPHMAKFLTPKAAETPPPASVDWSKFVKVWGMMLNETLGDCGEAGYAHFLQGVTAAARTEFTASDDHVQALYSAVTGYKPGDPSTDQGTVLSELLLYVLRHGFCGHRIVAYGAVDPQDTDEVKRVIAMLGGLYIGVALPLSAQDQEDEWDVESGNDAAPGSWGGHCIYCCGYDATHVTFVSWGKKMTMTWAFFTKYCDEAYGILAGAFITNGKAPNGIDVKTLEIATQKLRQS